MKKKRKYRVKYVSKSPVYGVTILKGYVRTYLDASPPRFFVSGIDNLKGVVNERQKLLAEEGICDSMDIKSVLPEAVLCIAEKEAVDILSDIHIGVPILYGDVHKKAGLHVSIEGYLLDTLEQVLESRLHTYEEKSESGQEGLLKPNLSMILSEVLQNYLLDEQLKKEKLTNEY